MTPSEDSRDVTQLLQAMRAGDEKATAHLLPLVYSELHRLAKSYMRRERQDHTLQATALVNEAYLKLAHGDVDWANREHFIGVAANVMRRVLVDYARQHKAEMRGGSRKRVELEEGLAITAEHVDDVLMVDELLERLKKDQPRQARVVELRYFGGLSFEQIAPLLEVSSRSVKRDWALARIWLFQQMRPEQKLPLPDA